MKVRLSAVLLVFLLGIQLATAQEATTQAPPAQPSAEQPVQPPAEQSPAQPTAAQAVVPDVRGMNVPQAAAALNLVGMALGAEFHNVKPVDSPAPVDVITGQSVPPGTPVTPGQTVDVGMLHNPNVTLIY